MVLSSAKDRENFWYALRSLRQSRKRRNQQNRRGFCKGQPEKERSSRFLRKGCRRCSDSGSCRKGRIYRTEHSGLSYVKLQHCSACKNETGFLIAFQKKICYNNSVGSKEIWRSALFFIHDNRMLAERAFYCFNEGSADFDLQIFRGGKLRFEIQEVSKEGYAL